jgi:hypothetical protein
MVQVCFNRLYFILQIGTSIRATKNHGTMVNIMVPGTIYTE